MNLFKVTACFFKKSYLFHTILIGFTFLNIALQWCKLFVSPIKETYAFIGNVFLGLGLILAIIYIPNIIRPLKITDKRLTISKSIGYLVLFLFFLLSLSPITNADSLHYHIGVPVSIFNFHSYLGHKEWFHFGLAGISENFGLIALALNTEHLMSLVQFFFVTSIIGLFYNENKKIRSSLVLLFLSCPVLIFLVSSAKPQLNGIALTSMVFFIFITSKVEKNLYTSKHFLFVFILLFSACATKMNFYISFFCLFILGIYLFKKRVNFFRVILGLLLGFSLVILPQILIKIESLTFLSFINTFLPLDNDQPGKEAFLSYLKSYSDSDFLFPFSIFFPSSFGNITMILGLNLVILIYILISNRFDQIVILLFIGLFIILSLYLGQKTARFYLEPYVWLLIFCYYKLNRNKLTDFGIIKKSIWFTGSISILILIFGVYTLSKGSLSVNFREEVLESSADGYTLSKWVNKLIPSNKNILLQHNSISLFNQKTFSTDWTKFVDFKSGEAEYYEKYLLGKQIDYIVIVDKKSAQNSRLYRYCGKLIYGPFSFKGSTRNPFNSGQQFYAWIFDAHIK